MGYPIYASILQRIVSFFAPLSATALEIVHWSKDTIQYIQWEIDRDYPVADIMQSVLECCLLQKLVVKTTYSKSNFAYSIGSTIIRNYTNNNDNNSKRDNINDSSPSIVYISFRY